MDKSEINDASREAEEFIRLTGASREAIAKLERYAEMLAEWSQKFNLIAPSTLPHIWSRHFLDSAQLLPLVKGSNLADMGAGAGFPGMVLSILGVSDVHLIESTGKKANFLRAVASDLGLNITIHQNRAEDIKDMRFDVITARALAPLKDLLSLSANLLRKEGYCVFLKGQKSDVELTDAKKYWMFDCEIKQSISDPSGSVLTIRNLRNNAYNRKRESRGH